MFSLLFQVGEFYAKSWAQATSKELAWSNEPEIMINLPQMDISFHQGSYSVTNSLTELDLEHYLLLDDQASQRMTALTVYFKFLDSLGISHDKVKLVKYQTNRTNLGLEIHRTLTPAESFSYKLSENQLRKALEYLIQDLKKITTKYVPTGFVTFTNTQFRFVGSYELPPQLRLKSAKSDKLVSFYLYNFLAQMKALGKFDATNLKI